MSAVTSEPLEDGVLGVTIASDEAPHLGPATVAGLRAVAEAIERDPGAVRAVVLLSGRRHFNSGASRELLTAADAAEQVPRLVREAPTALFDFPVPTIAAMRGHALGGGLLFGLWCDFPLLCRQSLYAANFVALGFPPGMGSTVRLPELFGPHLAQQMLLTGRAFTGDELVQHNPTLASWVLPAEAVLPRAIALAEDIARADPQAVRTATRLQHTRLRDALTAALLVEEPLQRASLADPTTRAAIDAAYPSGGT